LTVATTGRQPAATSVTAPRSANPAFPLTPRGAVRSPCWQASAVAVPALCGLAGRLVPPVAGAEGGGQGSQGGEAVGQVGQTSLHRRTPLRVGSVPVVAGAQSSGQGGQGGQAVGQAGQASLHHKLLTTGAERSAPPAAGAEGGSERGEGGEAVGQAGQTGLHGEPPGSGCTGPLGLLAGDER